MYVCGLINSTQKGHGGIKQQKAKSQQKYEKKRSSCTGRSRIFYVRVHYLIDAHLHQSAHHNRKVEEHAPTTRPNVQTWGSFPPPSIITGFKTSVMNDWTESKLLYTRVCVRACVRAYILLCCCCGPNLQKKKQASNRFFCRRGNE